MTTSSHKSRLQAVQQTWQRYYKSLIAMMLSLVCAITLTPHTATALDFGDLIRVLPAVVQYMQISSLSDQDEVSLGRRINQQLGAKVQISRDRQATELVRSIGQELATQSDRPDIPYTFQVVEDKSINAFATMGGFVYVNKGLIAAADNRAQLAGVIAHEIGHIAGRHAITQIKQAALTQGLMTAAGLDQNLFVQLGTQVALNLPNSREAEYDADRRGLITINKAGYAPTAMPTFMQKLLSKSSGGGGLNFLNSHPDTQARIEELNKLITTNNFNGDRGLNDQSYQQRWRSQPYAQPSQYGQYDQYDQYDQYEQPQQPQIYRQ